LTVWFGAAQLGRPFNQNGFTTYDWSVGLITNPDTFLIRDESDQVALPVRQLKNLTGFKKQVLEGCAGNARHLLGHYYVCTFYFQ